MWSGALQMSFAPSMFWRQNLEGAKIPEQIVLGSMPHRKTNIDQFGKALTSVHFESERILISCHDDSPNLATLHFSVDLHSLTYRVIEQLHFMCIHFGTEY